MKMLFLRLATYVLILAVFAGGVGLLGYNRSFKDFYGALRQEPIPSLQGVRQPEYDPNKPTVAVLLGNETTEGSDFMIPYELFSRTGAFNVFAVASDNQVKSLTGGLDLVPHYSFTELDQLLGKSPDIITIPFMVTNDDEKFAPIRKWIQQHSQTRFVSICGGSGNLAAAGLLKGKSAATHWQNLVVFPKQFPETNWLDDQRYYHDGNVISSAGVSSGIDAVLYVISQKVGEPVAEKIAKEMKYPSYQFVKNPKVDPFYMDFRFSTYLLNNAFQWNKKKVGVLLYNGVEEMALASVFDIYADTGTTRVLSISSSEQPIVTKHGLNLISRHLIANAPQLDKLMIPGKDANSLAAEEIRQWNDTWSNTNPQLVHSDSPDRFLFEVQLEDLAKQEDLLTAKHALKRLEFRSDDIQLEGRPFPLETYGNLLLTAFLALFIAFCIDRRFIIKKPFFSNEYLTQVLYRMYHPQEENDMKRLFLRLIVFVCIFTLLVGGVATLGVVHSQKIFYGAVRQEPLPSLQSVKMPKHDPAKPTVAVMLGSEATEGLDFMIPYEIFARTGAYNVYAVAADTGIKTLSGGLDVVPHYSFQEMDEMLGKSPDIIAIPFLTDQEETFEPAKAWILQHQETTIVSICGGAGNLASTGLLNGKSSTSHWQTIWSRKINYPQVDWKRDLRYVLADQNIVSSAGITSGIDAVLYVISQKLGEPMAAKVAKEMNYPAYHFVHNPKVDPFYIDRHYSTYVLNLAFQWNKEKAGVLLYDGVEEMALASVFDIYSSSGTTQVYAISNTVEPIVTKHGLNLIARHPIAKIPTIHKMIVPGTTATSLAAEEIKNWNEQGNNKELQFVHSHSPDRFLFEVQLEDLAKQEDLLTAKHAVKRLEYRASDIQLEGKPFPLETYGNLLLTAFLALFIAFYIDRRFIRNK